MGAAAAAIVAGGAVSAYGQYKANKDQAGAERANADAFAIQANDIEKAGQREEDIFTERSEQLVGQQKSALAKAGVDMSGSALLKLAATDAAIQEELFAIRAEKDANKRLALIRAQNSNNRADKLSDPGRNILQASGTLLGAGGSAFAASK
jgi:hypothetical protein